MRCSRVFVNTDHISMITESTSRLHIGQSLYCHEHETTRTDICIWEPISCRHSSPFPLHLIGPHPDSLRDQFHPTDSHLAHCSSVSECPPLFLICLTFPFMIGPCPCSLMVCFYIAKRPLARMFLFIMHVLLLLSHAHGNLLLAMMN